MDVITYALCKKFTKKTVTGLGALKGSPCKIKSITPIYSVVDPTVVVKNQITLEWDSNNTPSGLPVWHEETFETLDNGRGVYSVEYNGTKSTAERMYYDMKFYDGTKEEFYIPASSGALKKLVVAVLPPIESADRNTIYLVPVSSKPGSYQQWIAVENGVTHVWEWLSLGTTDVDLTEYQKKIDANLNKTYPNYDPATKGTDPINKNVVGGINEHQLVLGSTYDYTNNKIIGLNTYHDANIISALNDMGNLSNLEMWDPGTQTPATLVDAINHANATYELKRDITVDKTKFVDKLNLKKDAKDGSPIIICGDPVELPRVDLVQRGVPETNDYRTYDVKMAGELFNPDDPLQKIYGTVNLPTYKIQKLAQPTKDVTENITINSTQWIVDIPNAQYHAALVLSQEVTTATPTPMPTATFTPAIPGVSSVTFTAVSGGSKNVTIVVSGSGISLPASVVAAVSYKTNDISIDAQYYLDVEGLGYNEDRCGAKISIAKNMLLDGASVEVCVTPDVPIPGLMPGDKYIDLRFKLADGTISHAYIACKDLFDPYEGYQAIKIEYDATLHKNTIKLKINDPTAHGALIQDSDGLQILKADTTNYGVSKFATDAEVLEANGTVQKVIKPYDVYNFVNNSTSVKNDLQGLYAPGGQILNNTVIKAINELATTTVEKFDKTTPVQADENDIVTYRVKTVPTAGVNDYLGEKIHMLQTIYQTNTLTGMTNRQEYNLYYLKQLEGTNDKGLYMYDKATAEFFPVGGEDAVIHVNALPTTNIKNACLYDVYNPYIVTGRFGLSEAAKNGGYYINASGLHNDTITPSVHVSWAAVLTDWSSYYNDEIIDDTVGRIYGIKNIDTSVVSLVFDYEDVSHKFYYRTKKNDGSFEWVEIPTKFVPIPIDYIHKLTTID